MIADMRSSAIIWKHTSAILRSSAINCDCAIVWKPKPDQNFAIHDRNASHNIASSLPRFNARVFDCRNGLHYECVYYRSRRDFNDKNKKASYWDKIGQKILLSAEEAKAKFLQHKNCIRSLSNPKPKFSTVLELATTRLIMTNSTLLFFSSAFLL